MFSLLAIVLPLHSNWTRDRVGKKIRQQDSGQSLYSQRVLKKPMAEVTALQMGSAAGQRHSEHLAQKRANKGGSGGHSSGRLLHGFHGEGTPAGL